MRKADAKIAGPETALPPTAEVSLLRKPKLASEAAAPAAKLIASREPPNTSHTTKPTAVNNTCHRRTRDTTA